MADQSVLETLDPRVSELEIRLSFLEQTLAELDGVVRRRSRRDRWGCRRG